MHNSFYFQTHFQQRKQGMYPQNKTYLEFEVKGNNDENYRNYELQNMKYYLNDHIVIYYKGIQILL